MRASGQKLVKFCTYTHTTAAKLVVRMSPFPGRRLQVTEAKAALTVGMAVSPGEMRLWSFCFLSRLRLQVGLLCAIKMCE